MQRIRRLSASGRAKLRRSPELITREIDHADSAAPRQQMFVTLGQLTVPCSIRHYQNLDQC